MLGIAAAVGGYTVMELNQDLLTVTVTEGLTEDAITARLHEGDSSHMLPHLHGCTSGNVISDSSTHMRCVGNACAVRHFILREW